MNAKNNRRPKASVRGVLFLALCLTAPIARGEVDQPGTMPDRFSVRLGGFIVRNANTEVRVDDKNAGIGAVIDVDQALDLNSSADSPRIDMYYRFNPRHRVELGWYPVFRRGDKVLLEDLDIRDELFPAGTRVKSFFDTNTYKLSYSYSFFRQQGVELGVSVGLHITTFHFGVDAKGFGLEESFTVTAPLPIFGVNLKYPLTRKFSVYSSWQIFALQYNNYSGSQTDFLLGLEHQTFEHVGFGAGVNRYVLDLKIENSDFRGTIENSYAGYLAYTIVRF